MRPFSHPGAGRLPVSSFVVGQGHAGALQARDNVESEFAATVLSLPGEPVELDLPEVRQLAAGPGHIGRYVLQHQLGEGGLGTVHEAWDPLLSRTVAVKTLHFATDARSRQVLDRLFLNEARLAAGLSHPNIVTVHDAGLSSNGVYIAMERLQGRDLREALRGGWQPTPAQAALLVRRVADGLAYAHARGVVHCDIKPANIFLGPRDKPKILDFGIARAAHGSAVPALDGVVAGSPYYLAPEQIAGAAIDARTDLYALGVVLYELLAGRRAFEGDSLHAIQLAVLGGRAVPLAELRPEVPAALAELTARLMSRDPAARPASAAEVSMALRRWLEQPAAAEPAPDVADTAPEAGPVPAPRDAGTRARRRAGVVAAAILAAAATLWAGATLMRPTVEAEASASPLPTGSSVAPAATAALPAVAAPAADTPPPAALPAAPPAPPTVATTAAPTAPAAARPRPVTREVRVVPAAPPPTGVVRLAISPWGEVQVEGRVVGTTPPLARLDLPEGRHTITVRNEDFPPHVVTVDVRADEPVTVRHRFGS